MAAPKKAVGPKSDKEWRNALRLALHEEFEHEGQKAKALRLVAHAVVRKAMDGDIAAAKEIGDRLDGRPAQSLDVDMDVGAKDSLKQVLEQVAERGRR